MNVKREVIKKIGIVCDQTKKNRTRNSQVNFFRNHQLNEEHESEAAIMNHLQKVLLGETKLWKRITQMLSFQII
jgi:hypothetical protein